MSEAVSEITRYCQFCAAPQRATAVFCHLCGRQTVAAAEQPASAGVLADDPNLTTQKLSIESINQISGNDVETAAPPPTNQPLPQAAAQPETQKEVTVAAAAPLTDFRRTLEKKEPPTVADPEIEIAAQSEIASAPSPDQPENKTAETAAQPARPKTPRAVKTEYVWEESTSDPTWRFLLFTIAAVAFVVVIFWLARFIR